MGRADRGAADTFAPVKLSVARALRRAAHTTTGPAVALACLLLLAVQALPAGAGGSRRGQPVAVRSTLSNLKTFTRWAYPQEPALAHESPLPRSRVVGRLHFLTSDGRAEIYLALRSYTVGSQSWVLVPLPGRPNGATGWVPASALGEWHVVREYLRINRDTLRATLYRHGDPIWEAPVGVGRPSLPTPAGRFYVTEKLESMGDAFYGPLALGMSAYAPTLSEWPGGGVVGIHGTDEPELIPGRPSHGCVRLRNADIARLWRLVGVGTPVEIV